MGNAALDVKVVLKAKRAQKAIRSLSDNIKKYKDKDREIWQLMQTIAFASTAKHFEREKGPKNKWESWSTVYAARMAKLGKSGNKILQDTGRLRNSIVFAKSAADIQKGVLLFNTVPYSRAHDEGNPKGNLPARPFFYFNSGDLDNMAKQVLQFVGQGFGGR